MTLFSFAVAVTVAVWNTLNNKQFNKIHKYALYNIGEIKAQRKQWYSFCTEVLGIWLLNWILLWESDEIENEIIKKTKVSLIYLSLAISLDWSRVVWSGVEWPVCVCIFDM